MPQSAVNLSKSEHPSSGSSKGSPWGRLGIAQPKAPLPRYSQGHLNGQPNRQVQSFGSATHAAGPGLTAEPIPPTVTVSFGCHLTHPQRLSECRTLSGSPAARDETNSKEAVPNPPGKGGWFVRSSTRGRGGRTYQFFFSWQGMLVHEAGRPDPPRYALKAITPARRHTQPPPVQKNRYTKKYTGQS